MDQSPSLLLPYVFAAQSQKHVTVNESLRRLDAIVQLSVLDRDLAAPPGNPADGARYIIAASPSGIWSGHAGKVAAWQDAAWEIYTPREGWIAWVSDEDILVAWNGTAWVTAGGGGVASLNPASGGLAGVNATADTTNRLSVSSPASLFNHEGAGHQQKINKAAAGNTASTLFQTAFSGRAEMGLTGDDNWHLKVSADGSTWFEALVADRTTGKVSLPLTPMREKLTAARTYYVRTDGNDANTGLANTSGGAFLTLQKAYDVIASTLDLGGFTATVQVADGTYTGALSVSQPWTGGGAVTVQGNSGTPANVVLSPASNAITVSCVLPGALTFKDMQIQSSGGTAINHTGGGLVQIANVRFGTCGGFHIYTGATGAQVTATGNYAIVGGAQIHWAATRLGQINVSGRTITLAGTPAFSLWFCYATRCGVAAVDANTFSGSATGTRYYVDANGVLFTNGGGATYLPGNANGSQATGGQYI